MLVLAGAHGEGSRTPKWVYVTIRQTKGLQGNQKQNRCTIFSDEQGLRPGHRHRAPRSSYSLACVQVEWMGWWRSSLRRSSCQTVIAGAVGLAANWRLTRPFVGVASSLAPWKLAYSL